MMPEYIKNIKKTLLSDNWATLHKVTFDYRDSKGNWEPQVREVYDRGNGAAVLLYNKASKTVILTEQFRMPTYFNGNDSGMLIEVCAGLLDDYDPETAIKKEIEEETGYHLSDVEKVMDLYMSPGSVTETVHLFIAGYTVKDKLSEGGGVATENEDILVHEYAFAKAYTMIQTGEIKDAKTVILLQYLQLQGILS
ncbi:NUDIX domain-containing protein [uncultured Dokdonia sp.]|uniref:NUDIX domain-containing protein n=1 Tax=uncultured Dokdonia sp. TaxID=575653 RepID=UPI00260F2368|nr:NUDIX domain-containing protein [uncultured Dokdonia sp.]